MLKHKSSKSCSPINIAHPSPSAAWSCRNGSPFYRIQIMDSEFHHKAFGTSGARLTKAYDVTIQRYRNSHVKNQDNKMHILRCMGSKLYVKFHTKLWTHALQNMHFRGIKTLRLLIYPSWLKNICLETGLQEFALYKRILIADTDIIPDKWIAHMNFCFDAFLLFYLQWKITCTFNHLIIIWHILLTCVLV